MFEATVRDGVLHVRGPGARWLSTGWNGGFARADGVDVISVPTGWEATDIDAYVNERRRQAGITIDGPVLLTGVDMKEARGARSAPVVGYATVGLSNPAALPMAPTGDETADEKPAVGTVNLVIGTTRALDDAALASLLATATEAKTATLLAATGFTGTTTDAVVVGCDPSGEPAAFTGSATAVGAAARACVREAVQAGLRARYPDHDMPESVAAAEHGTRTNRRAEVFTP